MPSMLFSEKPPVSNEEPARRPGSRPSLVAPSATSRIAAGAGLVIRKSSSRVSSTRTARRRTSVAAAASGSRIEELAAEAATERRAGHADAGDRQAEQLRELGARVERALRRAGEVQDAVLVELGHRDLRLEVALVDPARREPALDDDIAARQGRGRRRRAGTRSAPTTLSETGLVRGELLGAATDRGVLRFAGRAGLLDRPLEARPGGTGDDRAVEVEDRLERGRLDHRRAPRRPPPPRASRRRRARPADRPTGSRAGRAARATGRCPR